jgi:hypothetical protein
VAIVVFGLIVSSITAVWSTQIVLQVWRPTAAATITDCRGGVVSLYRAVQRARSAAAANATGERAALDRFRRALQPEWSARPSLDAACASDSGAAAVLRQLDQLRYAEEHAVRYEASGLSEQRLRVGQLARNLNRNTNERPSAGP